MSAHGKRYREGRAAIDREKLYAPAEAFATLKAFPDAKFETISKLESDGKAVDEGYFIGTHTGELTTPTGETIPATGKKVKLRSCDIATVKDGMITEHHLFFDESEFMRQMGLSES